MTRLFMHSMDVCTPSHAHQRQKLKNSELSRQLICSRARGDGNHRLGTERLSDEDRPARYWNCVNQMEVREASQLID